MRRISTNNISAFLLYGEIPTEESETTLSYEKKIESSHVDFCFALKSLFPSIDIENEEMNAAIFDLTNRHSEIFMEIGIVTGFNLYKNLELAKQELDELKINAVIKS